MKTEGADEDVDEALTVFAADEQTDVSIDIKRWVRLARMVLEAQDVRDAAELSMLFVDAGTIAGLNKRFLEHDGPTDVLAFPMDDDVVESGRHPDQGGRGPGSSSEPRDPPMLIGDVVICPAVAQGQAAEHAGADHAGTLDDELALLVVHGVLHLLGFDHDEPDDAMVMQARERELLAEFKLAEFKPAEFKPADSKLESTAGSG